MKTAIKWAAGVAGVTLLAGTALSQTINLQWGNQRPEYQQQYGSQNGVSGPFSGSRRLMGQQVNSRRGDPLGQIKDIVFNAQTGEIIAVLRTDNGQNALVPLQAFNIGGSWDNPQITLNRSREELRDGPTVPDDRWVEALNHHPHLSQRIYSHYNVQSPNGMGGSP